MSKEHQTELLALCILGRGGRTLRFKKALEYAAGYKQEQIPGMLSNDPRFMQNLRTGRRRYRERG